MVVENTSNKIVGRMIANDVIGDDERAIYSYFGVLRGSTSGYHCKTSVGCFVLSSLACAFVVLLKDLALRYILYYQGGVDNFDDNYLSCWRYKPPEYGMV